MPAISMQTLAAVSSHLQSSIRIHPHQAWGRQQRRSGSTATREREEHPFLIDKVDASRQFIYCVYIYNYIYILYTVILHDRLCRYHLDAGSCQRSQLVSYSEYLWVIYLEVEHCRGTEASLGSGWRNCRPWQGPGTCERATVARWTLKLLDAFERDFGETWIHDRTHAHHGIRDHE